MLIDSVLGVPREVDIAVEGGVSDHKVVVGIECRAHARPQTVEWVEAMYGKHAHLPTDKLVLVSSSGFTRNALKLAEHLNIEAITPAAVTPGFIGRVVNNLSSVWAKQFSFTAEKVALSFDPPVESPDGTTSDRLEVPPGVNLHRGDSSVICMVGEFVQGVMRNNVDLRQPVFRDATAGVSNFTMELGDPLANGEPVYVCADDPGPPQTLRRITKVEIAGTVNAFVAEMPLTHAEYKGTPFSAGTLEVGDDTHHWLITEGAEGPRIGVRVLPKDNPTGGQFYMGTPGDWSAPMITPADDYDPA
ncbi:restriction endonuclease [[Mycobacterium] crassicus]|uniref:Restriction endonuclease n=1 Tax=[Mycobacterium] crassicus TaxID=2872309 RepID=A0ABU5XP56_9MYCO|nr:restriction endonuclease [Mycolicibacter sp. MYC098]MEB3024066.1 restriction endonuclease [Mycolicibacter sp. MYC098]